MKIFNNDIEGIFVARPNRFIVAVGTDMGIIRAHCPNPGRLEEILVPGRRLILEKSRKTERKTSYTLVGAYYKDKVIPLYSAMANKIAEKLVLPLFYPNAAKIIPEQKWGNSRFDFLVMENDPVHKLNTFLEVKACTLVEEGRAMFPDAPTKRGKKHIDELLKIVNEKKGYKGHILFIITHPDARVFTPNIHTDPDFSISLRAMSGKVIIDAVSTECTPNGEVTLINTQVPLDFKPVNYAINDSGAYIILAEFKTAKKFRDKKRGLGYMKEGYYIFSGEEDHALSGRVREIKNHNFPEADSIKIFLIYSGEKIEDSMAGKLKRIYGNPIVLPPFFHKTKEGISHGFYSLNNPMEQDSFLKVINFYRHTL